MDLKNSRNSVDMFLLEEATPETMSITFVSMKMDENVTMTQTSVLLYATLSNLLVKE